jgi:hypothetical protein
MIFDKIRNCRYKSNSFDSRLTRLKENSYLLFISLVFRDFDFIIVKKRLKEKKKSNNAMFVQETLEGPN